PEGAGVNGRGHLLAARQHAGVGCRHELTRGALLGCRAQRQSGALPGGDAAVEHRDLMVSKPAQQPPQSRRVGTAFLVVGDHLDACIDTETPERCRQGRRCGQRMATGARRAFSGQVAIEVHIERPWDVSGGIGTCTPLGSGKLEAAIDDRPVGVVEVDHQLRRFEQRCRHELHFRPLVVVVTIVTSTSGGATMAIEVFWGSGSPFAWRVLLALEYKRLPYTSHLLQFSKQEHKSHEMLALNPRGRVPVLKDGDYVCFESLAILYYLDLKYPQPPLFGRTPEEAGTIMRVICEYENY